MLRRVLYMKYNIVSTLKFNSSFRTFLSRIRIQISPDRMQIFGRPGSGLRIKRLIRIRKKTRIRSNGYRYI